MKKLFFSISLVFLLFLTSVYSASADTLIAYPMEGQSQGPGDTADGIGEVVFVDEIFTDINNRATASQSSMVSNPIKAMLQASFNTDQFQLLSRGFMSFDTSVIGEFDSIDSGTLSLSGTFKEADLGENDLWVVRWPCNSVGVCYFVDIFTFNDSENDELASIDYFSFNDASAYNDLTLNSAGLDNVEPEGITGYATKFAWEAADSFTGSWSFGGRNSYWYTSSDQAGTAEDPKLTIEYTPGVAPDFFTRFYE